MSTHSDSDDDSLFPLGPLLLGVDGGGSKTTATIAVRVDESRREVLGRGQGGPCNPRSVGPAAAESNLRAAIDAARNAAAVPAARAVEAACFAVAGTGRPAEQQWLREVANAILPAARLAIVHDALPLLAAATDPAWGVALVSGTGSLAYGRSRDGRTARCGGWGGIFGDEGSGYWIAIEALRACARAADGRGVKTELWPLLQQRLGIDAADQLIAAVYDKPLDRPQIAALAPSVAEAASSGDLVAKEILLQAGSALGEMVATTAHALRFAPGEFTLAITGGVLLGTPLLRDSLQQDLDRRGSAPAATTPVDDPTAGALKIASQLL